MTPLPPPPLPVSIYICILPKRHTQDAAGFDFRTTMERSWLIRCMANSLLKAASTAPLITIPNFAERVIAMLRDDFEEDCEVQYITGGYVCNLAGYHEAEPGIVEIVCRASTGRTGGECCERFVEKIRVAHRLGLKIVRVPRPVQGGQVWTVRFTHYDESRFPPIYPIFLDPEETCDRWIALLNSMQRFDLRLCRAVLVPSYQPGKWKLLRLAGNVDEARCELVDRFPLARYAYGCLGRNTTLSWADDKLIYVFRTYPPRPVHSHHPVQPPTLQELCVGEIFDVVRSAVIYCRDADHLYQEVTRKLWKKKHEVHMECCSIGTARATSENGPTHDAERRGKRC